MPFQVDNKTKNLLYDRLLECDQKLRQLPKLLNFDIKEYQQQNIYTKGVLAIAYYLKVAVVDREETYQKAVLKAYEIVYKYCPRLAAKINDYLEDVEIKQSILKFLDEKRKQKQSSSKNSFFIYQQRGFIQLEKDKDKQVKNQSNLENYLGKLNDNKLSEICVNLLDKPECLCQFPRDIKGKEEISFLCVHCNRRYHTVCMKKKTTSQFCCYCHLEKMVPLKRPVQTVFIGILRKSKKKHQAYFQIPDIQPNQRLQIRCLRLKQDAQVACLFPDMAEISMNGQRIALYQPINRQSCLKYRKDEPFNILKGDYYKFQENSFLLSETITLNRQRDIRNDPQNHLIAIFVVEDVKIDQVIEAAKAQNILGFSQSQTALQSTFGLGKDDEITCQIVKIPLICPLTTVKIDIPARGYYCTHYQCFDMKNFLTLISQSQNPRWTCPLCKSMSFELKIDSILLEVIKETKSNEKIKEILFFKNGDYSAIIDEEPLQQRKNIRSLNIPEKVRTRPLQLEKEQQRQTQRARQRKRVPFVIPQNAELISLDD